MTAAGAADTSATLRDRLLGDRARERGRPAISDALAVLGGIAIGVGLLLITFDIYMHHSSRAANVALFVALILIGFVVLAWLPATVHPAAITMIAIGVFGGLGWWLLPHARHWSDIRIFLVLAIAGYIACFVAPHSRGRSIFVALVLILAWLWILGEVVGPESYSAAPIPSPPPHTMFSLAVLHQQTQVSIDDLDPNDPLYPTAQSCDDGDMASCDRLAQEAPTGSDYQKFGAQCGSEGSTSSSGNCVVDNGGSSSSSGSGIFGTFPNRNPFSATSPSSLQHKETEIGLISLLFGLAYLLGLFLLDENGYSGLATAFVVPCVLALFSGTQTLGGAAHHAWLGGLLTLVAGIAFGIIGEVEERRFTAWFGAVMCGVGLLTVALDTTSATHNTGARHYLLKPGFVTIGSGLILVAAAALIALWLAARRGGPPAATPLAGPVPPPMTAPMTAPVNAPMAGPMAAPMTAPVTAPPPTPVSPSPAPEPSPEPGRSPWAPPAAPGSSPPAPASWGPPSQPPPAPPATPTSWGAPPSPPPEPAPSEPELEAPPAPPSWPPPPPPPNGES
jgi:hypothetical protein